MEPTTPAFATQVTSFRLTVFIDAPDVLPEDVDVLKEVGDAFFAEVQSAVERFSLKYPSTIITVTP